MAGEFPWSTLTGICKVLMDIRNAITSALLSITCIHTYLYMCKCEATYVCLQLAGQLPVLTSFVIHTHVPIYTHLFVF